MSAATAVATFSLAAVAGFGSLCSGAVRPASEPVPCPADQAAWDRYGPAPYPCRDERWECVRTDDPDATLGIVCHMVNTSSDTGERPMSIEIMAAVWDEPESPLSPRGWLRRAGEPLCDGYYLDYGPDNYRSPHPYCSPGSPCGECQPGNILAVRVTVPRESRWFESVAEARQWIEGAVRS